MTGVLTKDGNVWILKFGTTVTCWSQPEEYALELFLARVRKMIWDDFNKAIMNIEL